MRAAVPSLRRLVVIGVLLLGFVLGGSAAVWAQLAVEPTGLTVTAPQGEAETRTVTLTNVGEQPLTFCLSFDRPLQRAAGIMRLSDSVLGVACGAYGEVLALVDEGALPAGGRWDPYGLTMTPDGRLFVADYNDARGRTHELTLDLQHVRSFDHPTIEEVASNPVTTGVAYNADTGTLWWLNIESQGFPVLRALLLEGDLDGVPTGRRIELPVAQTAPPPYETGSPVGIEYDTATRLFYYVDLPNRNVWAVDSLGIVAEGYPITLEAYPDVALGFGLDTHSTTESDGAGLRFEVATNIPGQSGLRRVVTVGRFGEDTTPGGAEPLVTPLPSPNPGAETGVMVGEPVRSRVDPNGVLYTMFGRFGDKGVLAIRPHPLPPSWLVVEAWDGTLAPGASREVTLTFRPGQRSVGEYTAALQAFTAETGAAVEVPLTLTVTQGVDAEGEATALEVTLLAVYPNPARASATVELSLRDAGDVRVVVYDVLGRQVAVLHAGELTAGAHAFSLGGRALPAGVYLVRVESENHRFTERLTVVR